MAALDESLAEGVLHRETMRLYVDAAARTREPQVDHVIAKLFAVFAIDLDLS